MSRLGSAGSDRAGGPASPRPDAASEPSTAGSRALLEAALRVGPVALAARGVSMRPRLRAGDAVRLEARAPRRGDVALVAVGDRLVLHRLIRRSADRWLVQGDARPQPDGWVAACDVLAVAVARRSESDAIWRPLGGALERHSGVWLAPLRRRARSLRRALRPARDRRDGAHPEARG